MSRPFPKPRAWSNLRAMIRALPLCLLLAACSDFPEVGRAEADLANPGATPALLTADELAALSPAGPQPSAGLSGEVAALRERARRLRQR
jgi:hypothetical protein